MTYSGNRSSCARKRALRRLAREQRAAYRDLYATTKAHTQTHDQARGQARTLLRYRYPDRYLELYAQERVGQGTDLPAPIRSKAWLKANATLAELLAPAYRQLFEQMRARGLNTSCAYDMATSQLRHQNADLFADVLTDEIRLCLSETGPPDIRADCPACGSTSQRPGRDLCPDPCGRVHQRCLACGAALGQCYWSNARSAVELLADHMPAIKAALPYASSTRRPGQAADRVRAGPCSRAGQQIQGHMATPTTIDDKLAAAAAAIARMPEAKVTAWLEQLQAAQAQAHKHGPYQLPHPSPVPSPDSVSGPASRTTALSSQPAGYEHSLMTSPLAPTDTGRP